MQGRATEMPAGRFKIVFPRLFMGLFFGPIFFGPIFFGPSSRITSLRATGNHDKVQSSLGSCVEKQNVSWGVFTRSFFFVGGFQLLTQFYFLAHSPGMNQGSLRSRNCICS